MTNGVQSQANGYLQALKADLVAKGLLTEDGSSIEQADPIPEDQAAALWNWLYVAEEGSLGVHNPDYIIGLLEDALTDMGIDPDTVEPVAPGGGGH